MYKDRIIMSIAYIAAVLSAYWLRKITYSIATKAIKQKKLSTGIYTLNPVEGEKAVEIAKGYIRGVNIYFGFVILIFPLIFVLLLINGAI